MSAFDDPTEFFEAAAVFGAPPGDDRSDAAHAKSAAMRVGVVATVGVDELGLATRSAASAANRRDSVDERQQRNIVAVRAGHDHADRSTVRIYEDVVFGAWSCAFGGVWPGFLPAPTAARTVPSHPCLQHEQDAIECCTVRKPAAVQGIACVAVWAMEAAGSINAHSSSLMVGAGIP